MYCQSIYLSLIELLFFNVVLIEHFFDYEIFQFSNRNVIK